MTIEFRVWLENNIIELSLSDLLINRKSLAGAFYDFQQGRESRTYGPIHVWETDDGRYQLVDGYHRVISAILHQNKVIKAEIIGKGYSDYWTITKPQYRLQYSPSMTYKDLQNLYDKELLKDLGLP